MKSGFEERVKENLRLFVIRHRRLKMPAVFCAFVVLTLYAVLRYFVRNSKRFVCLACVLVFFSASSSFSYPTVVKLNISFVSDSAIRNNTAQEEMTDLSAEEETYTPDVELAPERGLDEQVMEEVREIGSDERGEITDDFEMISLEDIMELNGDLLGKVQAEAPSAASGERVFERDDWKLILVNKQHPIPDDYEFPLGNISYGKQCDQRIIVSLMAMLKAAQDDGAPLEIASPYRSDERQKRLFAEHIAGYMRAGMSYVDAFGQTAQAVTVPGSSEHQIGLAVDLVQNDHYALDEAFGETKGGKWLRDNSYRFGFILRYPKGKENITGIEYEPWHFRYVGVDAATEMYENDLCLEEFWGGYLY